MVLTSRRRFTSTALLLTRLLTSAWCADHASTSRLGILIENAEAYASVNCAALLAVRHVSTRNGTVVDALGALPEGFALETTMIDVSAVESEAILACKPLPPPVDPRTLCDS